MFDPAMYRKCLARILLADYESVLPELAMIIEANYISGTFSEAEDEFHSKEEDVLYWSLIGKLGTLEITFEKHEGYYFSDFKAMQPQFQAGKDLLWSAYQSQGGRKSIDIDNFAIET